MDEYALRFILTKDNIDQIRAQGTKICITKNNGIPGSDNVVWIALDPFPNISVSWTERYGMYATTTAFRAGARIEIHDRVGGDVRDEVLYQFSDKGYFDGYIDPPQGRYPNGTYALKKHLPEYRVRHLQIWTYPTIHS